MSRKIYVKTLNVATFICSYFSAFKLLQENKQKCSGMNIFVTEKKLQFRSVILNDSTPR